MPDDDGDPARTEDDEGGTVTPMEKGPTSRYAKLTSANHTACQRATRSVTASCLGETG